MGRWLYIPAAAGGFDPDDLVGLQHVWDIRNSVSITKDGSDRVAQWDDLKGSMDWVQAVDDNKPVWTATVQNGLPGLHADGSNDYMTESVTTLITSGTSFTMFWVYKLDSSPPAFQILGCAKQSGEARAYLSLPLLTLDNASYKNINWGNKQDDGGAWGAKRSDVGGISNTDAHILIISYDGNDPDDESSWDLIYDGSTQTVLSGGNTINGGVDQNYIFDRGDLDLPFKGYLHHMGLYSTVLSSGDKTSLHNGLNSIWSI